MEGRDQSSVGFDSQDSKAEGREFLWKEETSFLSSLLVVDCLDNLSARQASQVDSLGRWARCTAMASFAVSSTRHLISIEAKWSSLQ